MGLRDILKKLGTGIISTFALWSMPFFAHAHEVYVLSQDEITQGITGDRFSMVTIILNNLNQFSFWALIGVILVVVVFFFSTSRKIEQLFDPILAKLPRYAPFVGRVTIALSLFAGAYYQAMFGPELPLAQNFGASAPYITWMLVILGTCIFLGFYTRIAALGGLILFGYMMLMHGTYMITYVNYFGELLLLLIIGAHVFAVHGRGHERIHAPKLLITLKDKLTPFAFLFLRIAFGVALIYASAWAKILHNGLALQVASLPLAGHMTNLASVLGFEPHFLVLGAAIVEITIGMFFILGIEIRFTSLFLLFWLSLSLWYFGEIVWPHVILIGIPISFIFYGYDKYSLEGFFFKKGAREPVL